MEKIMKKLFIFSLLLLGSPALFAMEQNDITQTQQQHQSMPLHYGSQLLINAATAGDNEKIKNLLNQGVDVNSVYGEANISALMVAAARGKTNAITLLLD